jgi:AcrR family transcriptional regulator
MRFDVIRAVKQTEPAEKEAGASKGPGRPRCPITHQAILDAAMTLMSREPYAAISMDRIASVAKVGKQTLYRWWPSKADLMLEAYAGRSRVTAPVPLPTGDAIGDLRLLFRGFMSLLRDPLNKRMIRALVAEAQLDDAFRARFYGHLVDRRRAATREILRHGIAHGVIRADLDIELAIDLLYGPSWYWLLSGKTASLTDADADDAIQALVPWLTRAPAAHAVLAPPRARAAVAKRMPESLTPPAGGDDGEVWAEP